ncbi:MAG: hypothetical protein JWM37_315 [Candidatus Saccharibacteria bacterium]|nr:hypothetical protein [Candidatus Saccharibacteria bacterium]
MNTLQTAHEDAARYLHEDDYGKDYELPEVAVTHDVRYAVVGAVDAPNVILESAPYLTAIDKPHYLLRLMAQQEVLGENYAVVGIEAFNPAMNLTHRQRKAIAAGSFSVYATNVLRVAEAVHCEDDQVFSAYGYSLGGDVAVQTAYDVATNENRGVINIQGLGAVEAARVDNRGLRVVKAMADSGKNLWQNVRNSESEALNVAWGIDENMTDEQIKEAVSHIDVRFLAGYMLRGPLHIRALISGSGTRETVHQLDHLSYTDLPVVLGRQAASKVCTPEFIDRYAEAFTVFTEFGNDHSADDNLIRSAGRALFFARTIDA